MNSVKSYLMWPDVEPYRLGARWSKDENSLVTADGIFAFAEEVAEFLEGFASFRRIVHFAYMVRMLMLLRQGPDEQQASDTARRRLWRLYTYANDSLRNAGAFCGRLCRDIPAAREANQVADICRRLRGRELLSPFLDAPQDFIQTVAVGYQPPELPPFNLNAFDGKIADAFQSCSDEEVIYWFKHGRAPIDENAAKRLAQSMPPTLAGRLASLLLRTRLTRARAWVAQLFGALSLPPRRLENQSLPLGGYSDVTTRGQVDQILPSQFALDEWDFFRRYAEHELLYFRREDPRDPTRQELVVVLDQGVRTWGDIRLVLGAALFAFGKQALVRGQPFLLATTSVNAFDLLQLEEKSLGEVVEACDLSPHPGLALEGVLEQPSKKDRDIVLLTHPRNLCEDEVRAAARRLRPGARLFALTLDRHGQAELSEFKHGVPIAIRQFRVDYSLAPTEATAAPPQPATKWTGDVEPIGFPFHFGVNGRIGDGSFDFDLAGGYLLTAASQGLLHLWDRGGKLIEILPRAMWQGRVVQWASPFVLGVANGFVVAGLYRGHTLAMHYDLEDRRCTCHLIRDCSVPLEFWNYSPSHHCLIVANVARLAVDLRTGERFDPNLGGSNNRAQDAWIAWEKREIPSRQIYARQDHDVNQILRPRPEPCLYLDSHTGSLRFERTPVLIDEATGRAHTGWATTFRPLASGQPMLRDRVVLQAQVGGMNLALQTSSTATDHDIRLDVIRYQDGIPIGEYATRNRNVAFRLSADGALLARQIGGTTIELHHVAGSNLLGRTFAGGCVQELLFVLGDYQLLIQPGRHAFLLDWSNGKLECAYHSRSTAPELKQGIHATADGDPAPCKYDARRWRLGASGAVLAASDRYGQLAVFDRRQNLICMFFAFRTRLSGWLPDGTSFSQVSTAEEATLIRFGRALQAASRVGKSS